MTPTPPPTYDLGKAVAPPAIPVRARFYLTECEHCGWIGSSEQCSTDAGGQDDSDVYCPVCSQAMLCDGPNETDTAEHGQAVFDRIAKLEAELATLRAENARLQAYATEVGTALVRLTCDGSEFYRKAGDVFEVDPTACSAWVRRSRQTKHETIVRLTHQKNDLQSELATLKAVAARDAEERVRRVRSALVAAENALRPIAAMRGHFPMRAATAMQIADAEDALAYVKAALNPEKTDA